DRKIAAVSGDHGRGTGPAGDAHARLVSPDHGEPAGDVARLGVLRAVPDPPAGDGAGDGSGGLPPFHRLDPGPVRAHGAGVTTDRLADASAHRAARGADSGVVAAQP